MELSGGLVKSISAVLAVVLLAGGGLYLRKRSARIAVEQQFVAERARLGQISIAYDQTEKQFQAQASQTPALPLAQLRETLKFKMLSPMQQTLHELQAKPSGWQVGGPLHVDYLAILSRVAAAQSLDVTLDLMSKMEDLQKQRLAGRTNAALMSNAVASSVLPLLQSGFGELTALLDAANLTVPERQSIEAHLAGLNRDLRHGLMVQMLALEEYSAYSTVYADTQKYFALKKSSTAGHQNLSLAFLQGAFLAHVQAMGTRLQGVQPYFQVLSPKEVAPLVKEIQNSMNKVLLLTQAELDSEADARFLQFQRAWALAKKKGGKNLLALNTKSILPPSSIGREERVPASQSTKLHHSLRALRLARENVLADIELRMKSPHPDLNSAFIDWAKISRSPLKASIEASVKKLEKPAKS